MTGSDVIKGVGSVSTEGAATPVQMTHQMRDAQRVMASDVMCLCVFLLCSGLQFTTGCEVLSSSFVSCSAGESVLLPCRDINSRHTEDQWWICDSQTGNLQYSVYPVDASEGQRYKDRVQIHGNLSLSITRLSVDDTAAYCCKTTETKRMSPVQLTVEGCSISGNEGSVEISRYSGESVFLSCLVKCSPRYKPDSEFRWKLPNYREINQNINPDELHRLYQGRFHMFDIRSGNLSLLISDLTEKDEGLYSCWSKENQHKSFSLTVKGCTLSETEREPKTKYTGDSVLLSCSCEDPNTKPEDFRWTHVESSGTEVSNQTPRYKDRVQMFHKTTPSNLSLLISNLTEDDQGTYRCTINHKISADTRLIVKGCTLSETEREPKTKYTGDSVLLSCSCEDPNTKPEDFRWTHVESSGTEVSNETPRYKDRVQMFHKTTPSNLSLLISNLTEDDQGTYRCTINHKTSADTRLIIKGCVLSEHHITKSSSAGGSVILPCSCEDPKTKPEDFRWTHVESSGTEVSSETPRYKDRVQMFHKTTPSNLSLLISNLTEDDQGTYRCTINHKTSADTRLIIKGCVLSEHHITKSSSAGGSVILPCSCEDPKTKPEHFEWIRAAVNETLVSDAEEINGRFRTIRDSPHNLFLRISNLNETDGGVYVCSVNGKQSRRVTLTVTDSADINSLDYQYYLIFLVFLLCLMLLLVAGCICWRFTRASKQRRGSRLIQSPDDKDDTYTSVVYSSS